MKRLPHVAIVMVLIGVVTITQSAIASTTGELVRCATIDAPETRLACYDTVAGRPVDHVERAVPPKPTAAAPSPDDPKNFGLTQAQLHAPPQGPQAIAARIASLSNDQQGHALLLLDNGQSWSTAEDDGRLSVGDAVTIKRASLGSFLLMSPSKHIYSVHRIK